MELSLFGVVGTIDGGLVSAKAVCKETGDTPYCCHTDACEVVDLSVGKVLLEIFHDLPSVDESLKFRRRAQILKEIAALLKALEAVDGLE